jgi:uncharacterized 2Fe-2S/4Fe-4S cluster protein (DUF4445 family)
MARLTFYQAGKKILAEAEAGTSILAAARRAGVLIDSPCNGNGTCGKCKVRLHSTKDLVLACHTEVEDNMAVEILERRDRKDVQILADGQKINIKIAGLITKNYNSQNDTTAVFAGTKLLATEAGNTEKANYGVVVDIGTTTLVAALYDLRTGRELAASSALNPQSHHAQDVLSRIKFASTPEGLQVMHEEFISVLNQMLKAIASEAGIKAQHIYEVIFSGNTCMLHLAVKESPVSLGKFPYTPLITGDDYYPANSFGINVSEFALLYLPPVMSAYVGADITSGILAAQLKDLAGLTLFVDIGTNGEMVLASDGKLLATSTAAGPAFEGMNISCGMRAAPGAVEKFHISDQAAELKTIGDEPPIGICGSGLIDIVGELVKHGAIKSNGKLAKDAVASFIADRIAVREGKQVFEIAGDVYLSQKDIRQVQLAKGAIRAGIEALMTNSGVQPKDIDRVYIAGSFGFHLDPNSLINIGLLPESFAGKIEFLGNTSKTGGQAFLVNNEIRQEMAEVVQKVKVLELATTKNFDKLFINCLNF